MDRDRLNRKMYKQMDILIGYTYWIYLLDILIG
jgi:hypothetical protein